MLQRLSRLIYEIHDNVFPAELRQERLDLLIADQFPTHLPKTGGGNGKVDGQVLIFGVSVKKNTHGD